MHSTLEYMTEYSKWSKVHLILYTFESMRQLGLTKWFNTELNVSCFSNCTFISFCLFSDIHGYKAFVFLIRTQHMEINKLPVGILTQALLCNCWSIHFLFIIVSGNVSVFVIQLHNPCIYMTIPFNVYLQCTISARFWKGLQNYTIHLSFVSSLILFHQSKYFIRKHYTILAVSER